MGVSGIFALILLGLISILGLAAIPLGLPGTFLIFLGALCYNLVLWSMAIGPGMLGLLLALALAGEVLEYWVGVRLASRRGASGGAIAGGVAGGLIGAVAGVPVPVAGSLIGLFAGVFAGAFFVEWVLQKEPAQAFRAAAGAFYGRAGAIVIKTLLGLAMVGVLFAAVL
jgi:uncharacterized protein YqgC (DUF456 family)